jgi:hypothetical protein
MKKINNFGEFVGEGFLDRFKRKNKSEFDHRSYEVGYSDLEPDENPKPNLNDAADTIHPIDYSLVSISDELTPEKLEEVLDEIVSIEDPDVKARLIRKLKLDHPHIIDSEPYRKIYWNAIKKWHESIK